MSTKKVILEKTEYDAMEEKLNDLINIVDSRTLVTVIEEYFDWRSINRLTNGARIKYIIAKDIESSIKQLTDQIEHLKIKAEKAEIDYRAELLLRQEEIETLKKKTWLQKLFNL